MSHKQGSSICSHSRWRHWLSNCCSKVTVDSVAYKQQRFISYTFRGWEVQDHGLSPLRASSGPQTSSILMWWKGVSGVSFTRILIPTHMNNKNLMIYLMIQHMNGGGDTNIQAIALSSTGKQPKTHDSHMCVPSVKFPLAHSTHPQAALGSSYDKVVAVIIESVFYKSSQLTLLCTQLGESLFWTCGSQTSQNRLFYYVRIKHNTFENSSQRGKENFAMKDRNLSVK